MHTLYPLLVVFAANLFVCGHAGAQQKMTESEHQNSRAKAHDVIYSPGNLQLIKPPGPHPLAPAGVVWLQAPIRPHLDIPGVVHEEPDTH